tara:strand:- start:11571 stop:11726 length:156 start_codon:yes stop_codon:yes gene_type:complete
MISIEIGLFQKPQVGKTELLGESPQGIQDKPNTLPRSQSGKMTHLLDLKKI